MPFDTLTQWLTDSELMAGGWIMGAILALSFLMWVLILDRYVFLWRSAGGLMSTMLNDWQSRHGSDPVVNRRLRAGLVSAFHGKLASWTGTIAVITAILPLLGLLGTVAGMIKTFEVMTVFGTGNVRGMAEGISQALITTMGGLCTALTGVFFSSNLEQKIRERTDHLAERMVNEPDRPLQRNEGMA
ncbi:MAG: hypothetical protein RLZZ385_1257 [Pseudomonadota bacterium]